MKEIVSYGVMVTPALVVDEKVIKSGRALSVKEIKKRLLMENKGINMDA